MEPGRSSRREGSCSEKSIVSQALRHRVQFEILATKIWAILDAWEWNRGVCTVLEGRSDVQSAALQVSLKMNLPRISCTAKHGLPL